MRFALHSQSVGRKIHRKVNDYFARNSLLNVFKSVKQDLSFRQAAGQRTAQDKLKAYQRQTNALPLTPYI